MGLAWPLEEACLWNVGTVSVSQDSWQQFREGRRGVTWPQAVQKSPRASSHLVLANLAPDYISQRPWRVQGRPFTRLRDPRPPEKGKCQVSSLGPGGSSRFRMCISDGLKGQSRRVRSLGPVWFVRTGGGGSVGIHVCDCDLMWPCGVVCACVVVTDHARETLCAGVTVDILSVVCNCDSVRLRPRSGTSDCGYPYNFVPCVLGWGV